MVFCYINTDEKNLGYSPHAKWIRYGYAFTAGDEDTFGEKALGRLNPGVTLFMYANGAGVVAAGKVVDFWQGSSYKGRDRLVYQYTDYTEYRIPVDWYLPIVASPISRGELVESIVGWASAQVLQPITNESDGERLLKEVQKRV